jgi:hypothetical protein
MSEIKKFNGFNCGVIPNDWEDYKAVYKAERDRFLKCFNELYAQKQFEYLGGSNVLPTNDPCLNKTNEIYMLFEDLLNETETKMNLLIAALAAATPNQPETFDVSIYYSYIDTYDNMIETSKNLILMLNTRCGAMGIENNVGVDTQTLGTKIVHQCSGVYMKQMDNGSEFIGKITSTSNANNPIRNY